ncbi:MAG: autotransporter-associated beta strand repeat-containing protein [Thermoguttaceae bacterium]|nr:autotransporter-associated beta strand repeat-containing protein [Thermoguttaceae bacterium]
MANTRKTNIQSLSSAIVRGGVVLFTAFIAVLSLTSNVLADAIYQTQSMPGGKSWADSAYWSGAVPTTSTANDYYVGQGITDSNIVFRTKDLNTTNSSDTFPAGNTLWMGYNTDGTFSSAQGQIGLKAWNFTVNNLQLGNSLINQAMNTGTINLKGSMAVNGTVVFQFGGKTDRMINVQSAISGAGEITLVQNANNDNLIISSANNAFTGTLNVAQNSSVNLTGANAMKNATSVILNSGSSLKLSASEMFVQNSITGSGTLKIAADQSSSANETALYGISDSFTGTINVTNSARGYYSKPLSENVKLVIDDGAQFSIFNTTGVEIASDISLTGYGKKIQSANAGGLVFHELHESVSVTGKITLGANSMIGVYSRVDNAQLVGDIETNGYLLEFRQTRDATDTATITVLGDVLSSGGSLGRLRLAHDTGSKMTTYLRIGDATAADENAPTVQTINASVINKNKNEIIFQPGANRTVTVAGTLSNDNSGGFTKGYIKEGVGTLVLNGALSTQMTVNGGAVQLKDAGVQGTGSIALNAGVLELNVSDGLTETFGNALTGSGALLKTGLGKATVTSSNTGFSGATTVSEGTLAMTNVNGIGTGAATVESGATLEMATGASETWNWAGGAISGAGTLKVSGGGAFNIPVTKLAIDTNGALVADGSSLTINNLNGGTFTGKYIDINNGGSVTIDPSANDKALWLSNQTEITFDAVGGGSFNTGNRSDNILNLVNNSATTFTTNGGATNYVTGSNGFNLHNAGITFNVAPGTSDDGVDLVVSAKLWNSKGHGITKNGDGTMKITGAADNANNYTGATTINAGQLILSGDGRLGSGAGAVSIAQGATLTFADDLAWDTMSNAVSGAGKIVKQGTNTVNLDGAFSFSGDVAVNDGTLSVLMGANTKQINVNKISGAGDLELRISNSAGNIQFPNLTPDNFTGKISLVNNSCTDTSKVYTNRRDFDGVTFEINPGTTVYVEYAELKAKVLLAGDGNKEGYGALRINDNMSGDLVVTADGLLGINGSRTVSSDITSGADSGVVTLKIQANTNNTSHTFSGDLSDGETSQLGVSIVKKQNGTFTFTGDLSYTGPTSIADGQTMVLSGADANLATSSDVAVNGTLDFAGYTGTGDNVMTLNNITGSGTVTGTGKDLVLYNDEDSQFTGTITAQNIEVTGAGTLKFANESGSSVNALSFTVANDRFDLKGAMTGDLIIEPGCSFSPGNSVGTADVTGNVLVKDGGKIIFEFSPINGNDYDVLTIVNDQTVAPDFTFTANPSTIELFFEGDDASLWAAALESDPSAGYLLVSDEGFSAGDYSYWLTNDYGLFGLEGREGGLYLIAAAEPGPGPEPGSGVPEPSTWALLALGVAGLMYWRKRK